MTGVTHSLSLATLTLALAVASVSLFGCSEKPSAPAPKPASPPAEKSTASAITAVEQDRIVDSVRTAIARHHLTGLPSACIAYRFDDQSQDVYSVQVRKNSNDPKCGGDPGLQPRLFTIRIDKKTGAMSTDAGDANFEFHPLR